VYDGAVGLGTIGALGGAFAGIPLSARLDSALRRRVPVAEKQIANK
jgi:hypothetical protein